MNPTEGVCDFENAFNRQVREINAKVNSICITNAEHYDRIIGEVIVAKNRAVKKPLDYRRLKRYDTLRTSDRTRLILPANRCADDEVKLYVHRGELFGILKTSHLETGHGGLHKMHVDLRRRYVNVTRSVIQVFLANCKTCLQRRVGRNANDTAGPGASREKAQRAQVDLLDMRSCKDNEYGFIIRYRDCASTFVLLRAARTKTVEELAHSLIDIFCAFGAPAVLQSDRDGKFLNGVVDRLRGTVWSAIKIHRGKPRYSWDDDDGCVEKSDVDLLDFLKSWMIDNNTTRWSEGLRYYQHRKNNTFRSDIKQLPFERLFNRKSTSRYAPSPDDAQLSAAI